MPNCWIVVADSSLARFFDTDTRTREMDELASLIHTESRAKDQELSSDRPGREFDRVGTGRHEMSSKQSPHQHEAELFARTVAKQINEGYQAKKFAHLRLAAPPAFLGLLRKFINDNVQDAIDQSLDKDLVHQTPAKIATHFLGPPRQSNKSKHS